MGARIRRMRVIFPVIYQKQRNRTTTTTFDAAFLSFPA